MRNKQFNAPITMQIYLGSGKSGARLRENLERMKRGRESLSQVVLALMKKADPTLFKGIDDAKS